MPPRVVSALLPNSQSLCVAVVSSCIFFIAACDGTVCITTLHATQRVTSPAQCSLLAARLLFSLRPAVAWSLIAKTCGVSSIGVPWPASFAPLFLKAHIYSLRAYGIVLE